MTLALRIAVREARAGLRGGLRGFRVFLLCLILGVAAIAAVGLVRASIRAGLVEQGAVLLGGDAEYQFTYREATADEAHWIAARSRAVSQVVEFRSMLGRADGSDFTLTQVKAVDGAYPLLGTVTLDPPVGMQALAPRDGVPGAFLDGALADRLGVKPGDRVTLGGQPFEMRARLLRAPDTTGAGIALGPRSIVALSAVRGTPMLAPGSLYESEYRVLLPEGQPLAALKAEALKRFDGAGLRWTDSRRASPGTERFTDQLAAFLVLVGLAGLAVGGVGISAATGQWIEGKAATIATLRALGATAGLVRRVFLIQLAGLTALGVVLGLALASGLVLAAAGPLARTLPFPVRVGLSPQPLAEAALFGVLATALFTLWPLARMARLRTARLYRVEDRHSGWPGWGSVVLTLGIAALIAWVACLSSGMTRLTLATLGGIAAALLLFALAGRGVGALARIARPLTRRRPMLLAALAALAGRGGEARAAMLSLGLGLSVLASVGQIEAGIRGALSRDLPKVAPAWFLIDIQADEMAPLRTLLAGFPAVSRVDTAPMLRGVITQINGRPAREGRPDHWVLRGDRGVTYAATPREPLTAGTWWPEDYSGPPQASFAAKEGRELGLKLGDTITVNILGRDITATITSFRDVNFSTAGIGFVLTLDPAALAGAPHTEIATVYAPPEAEAPVLRAIATTFPNITAVGVREAIGLLAQALDAIGRAVALAASVTLVTGIVVLIGAAAAGEGARTREAALLRTLGATRAMILGSFALRFVLTGAAAGVLAVAVGALSGWGVMRLVMEAPYHFAPVPALAIVLGGIGATVLAGVAFALRPLARRPAVALRESE